MASLSDRRGAGVGMGKKFRSTVLIWLGCIDQSEEILSRISSWGTWLQRKVSAFI